MTINDHTTILTISDTPDVTVEADPEDGDIITLVLDDALILVGTSEVLQETATTIITALLLFERDTP